MSAAPRFIYSCVNADSGPTDARRAQELFSYFTEDELTTQISSSTDVERNGLASMITALEPFSQLTLLRCKAKKVMINVMDRDTMYFLSTASALPDDPDYVDVERDPVLHACSEAVPLKGRVCEMTIRMAPDQHAPPMFVVPDLTDSPFAHLNLVQGPPYLRFYAGTPITTRSGINIGSLAFMDTESRQGLTTTEEKLLGSLARRIVGVLETNQLVIEGKKAMRLASGLQSFVSELDALQTPEAQSAIQHSGHSRSTTPSPKEQAIVGAAPTHDLPHLDASAPSRADLHASKNHDSRRDEDWARLHPHSEVFKQAADYIHGAFQDLGDRGCVAFLSVRRRNWEVSCAVSPGAAESISPPAITPQEDKLNVRQSLASMIAKSAVRDAYERESQTHDTGISNEALVDLTTLYPDGCLITLGDTAVTKLAAPDHADLSTDDTLLQRRQARSELQVKYLRSAFPDAYQILFAPIWNAQAGAVTHVVFVSTSSERRAIALTPDLALLKSFCFSVMAKCSQMDAVTLERNQSDFIGTISHEMRSPLHGVLAAAELMADTTLNDYQKSLTKTVERCGNTLLQTINHLLDFSKINRSRKDWYSMNDRTEGLLNLASSEQDTMLALAPNLLHMTGVVEIGAVTEEVIDSLVSGKHFTSDYDFSDLSLENRGFGKDSSAAQYLPKLCPIPVILNIDKENWAFVTQPGAIRRILLNLVGNALTYTQEGSITVNLALEKGERSEQNMKLSVIDTGIGIGAEFLKTKLFTPFTQENILSPGTGLGLSIVQNLIAMLDGTINVSSEVNRGTTVQVSIPLQSIDQASRRASVESSNTSLQLCKQINAFTDQKLNIRIMLSSSLRPELAGSLSRYLVEWYDLKIVDCDPDIVVLEETDVDNAQHNIETVYDNAAILVLCSIEWQHRFHKLDKTGSGNPRIMETLTMPVGPYKLAKGVAAILQRIQNGRSEAGGVPQDDAEQTIPATTKITLPTVPGSLNGSLRTEPSPVVTLPDDHSIMEVQSSEHTHAVVDPVVEDGHRARSMPTASTDEDGLSSDQIRPASLSDTTSIARSSLQTHYDQQPFAPRILIVDDNKINLNLLKTYLAKRRKYESVQCAEDGRQAVEAVKSAQEFYDIIFMDISMPVMDGFEATRIIRSLDFGGRTPLIIALTGLASARDQAEGLQAGMDIYLTKPVRFKIVDELLNNWSKQQLVVAS